MLLPRTPQVRLTYWSLDSVLVSWHCCDEQVVNGTPTALNTNGMQPKVYYDTDFGRTATGVSTSYVHDHTGLIINSTGADNNGKPYPSYQSGYINHVILRGRHPPGLFLVGHTCVLISQPAYIHTCLHPV
jgi:hypothetical protein